MNLFTKQEGASKEDIELLPKFTFLRDGGAGKTNDEIQGHCGGIMTEYGTDTPIEHVLSPEDAVRSLSLHTQNSSHRNKKRNKRKITCLPNLLTFIMRGFYYTL